jgi:hypothetical protein
MEENEEKSTYDDSVEFEIWLSNGIERGWISDPFCHTHDGDPYMTPEEEQEWEDGGDPCCFVLKVFGSK